MALRSESLAPLMQVAANRKNPGEAIAKGFSDLGKVFTDRADRDMAEEKHDVWMQKSKAELAMLPAEERRRLAEADKSESEAKRSIAQTNALLTPGKDGKTPIDKTVLTQTDQAAATLDSTRAGTALTRKQTDLLGGGSDMKVELRQLYNKAVAME